MRMTEMVGMVKCSADQIRVMDLEDAILCAEFTDMFCAAFERRDRDVPKWLAVQRRALTRYIAMKQEEELERELAMIDHEIQALRKPEEKRGDLQTRAAELRARLGYTAKNTSPEVANA